MKELSCGILVFYKNELLIGHPTNHKPNRWNIPKGHIEEGETPIECAIRETFEESNLTISPEDLTDLGRVSYIPKKDLHLFITHLEKKPPQNALKCNSYYNYKGHKEPEFDELKFIDFSERNKYFSNNLQRAINKSLENYEL